MKDDNKKKDSGKFYTIVKTVGSTVKRIKRTEKELTEEDVIYFYKLIAEAYNSAPLAAQLTFMSNAMPAYLQAVEEFSSTMPEEDGSPSDSNVLGGPVAEA